MIYEDDIIKVQEDGGSLDVDVKGQPEDTVWLGIHGIDLSIRRIKGEDGDPDLLVVDVWEPGVVSSPVASLEAVLGGK